MIWIAIAIVLLVIWRIWKKVKLHTRGMGLGFGVVSGGDPSREGRNNRYIRRASAEYREKDIKLRKKANKPWNRRRQKNLLDRAFSSWLLGSHHEKIAEENTKSARKHGIRVRGKEKGWWKD